MCEWQAFLEACTRSPYGPGLARQACGLAPASGLRYSPEPGWPSRWRRTAADGGACGRAERGRTSIRQAAPREAPGGPPKRDQGATREEPQEATREATREAGEATREASQAAPG